MRAPLNVLRVAAAAAALMWMLPAAPAGAQAQQSTNTDISQQYRITAYPAYALTEKVTGIGYIGWVDEPSLAYQSYYLGKGVYWTPKKWLEIWAVVIGVYTDSKKTSDSLEIRPFPGVKFKGTIGSTNLLWYNWTRWEVRFTETMDTHKWSTVYRLRNQTRLSIPLASKARAWKPKSAYVYSDIEPIWRSDDGDVDPLRLRFGLGYVASPRTIVEFQYYVQWTQPDKNALAYTTNIWRLNFKFLLDKSAIAKILPVDFQ